MTCPTFDAARPYRLNPDYPPEGVDQKKSLEEKLGGAERVAQAHKMLTDFGKEVGINFNFEAIKIGPNTLDAHRLIHWAMIEDRDKADKVVNGRYAHDKNFDAFLSGFPIDDPQYVVLVILDEPKPYGGWPATAGANCAPTVGAIIRRAAPLLGVEPEFGHESGALLVSYR